MRRFAPLLLALTVSGLSCQSSDSNDVPCGDSTCRQAPPTEAIARTQRAACQFKRGDAARTTVGVRLDDAAATSVVLGDDIPIQYVFVLMLENRSFDSYFGRFQAYLSDPKARDLRAATNASPFPAPGDDPRLFEYRDPNARDAQGRPVGVDVPPRPYDKLEFSDQVKDDKFVDPNASSVDFARNFKRDGVYHAPYNPTVAGAAGVGSCQKHYWRHAGDKLLRDGPVHWSYATDLAGIDQCVADTCHEWWCSHMQWDAGRMDGFFQSNDGYWEGGEPMDLTAKPRGPYPPDAPLLGGGRAMLYYDWTDIPFYYWLADNFAIADHYHAAMLGPTWPNRDYLYAATSRGLTSNSSQKYGNSAIGGLVYGSASALGVDQKFDPKEVLKAPDGTTLIHTLYDNLRLGGPRAVGFNHWLRGRSLAGAVAKNGTWYGLTGPQGPPPPSAASLEGNPCTAPSSAAQINEGYEVLEDTVKRENQALLDHKSPCFLNPVNFIDPDALEDVNGEDEHPPGSPQMGQRLVWDVVRILMANAEVWKRSVLFVTYDEHGGFYDHVPPPTACPPDSIDATKSWSGAYGGGPNTPWADGDHKVPRTPDEKVDATDTQYGSTFDRYGIRVPLTVISPWAKPHYVSHYTYDHTSIVRFIEARFKLNALTNRDANADPLFDLFDFSSANEKLAGTGSFARWGTEALPTDPRYATVSHLDGAYAKASLICVNSFPPSSLPYPTNLAKTPYDGYDWSPGKSPPCGYNSTADGPVVKGCATYAVSELGSLNGTERLYSAGFGLSADGTVGVTTQQPPAYVAVPHAWKASTAQMDLPIDLHVYNDGNGGIARGVNDANMITGTSAGYAVIWADKRTLPLGTLGGDSSAGWAINNFGHVAGESRIAFGSAESHAFVFTGQRMTDLGKPGETSRGIAINKSDVVAGFASGRAVKWVSLAPQDLSPSGATSSVAQAINDAGWVAGDFTISGPDVFSTVDVRAFATGAAGSVALSTDREASLLPPSSSDYTHSHAYGIGQDLRPGLAPSSPIVDYDVVVGSQQCVVGGNSEAAVRWRAARKSPGPGPNWVVENLNALIGDSPPMVLTTALAINATGSIVAFGHPKDKTTGRPLDETRLYLLVPNRTPLMKVVKAPSVSFTALVNTATYTGVFSASGYRDSGVKMIFGDGHAISLSGTGGTTWGAQGTITAAGVFTATGAFFYPLTITGPLDLDPTDNTPKPLQTLNYVLEDPAGTKSGTLTLTRN